MGGEKTRKKGQTGAVKRRGPINGGGKGSPPMWSMPPTIKGARIESRKSRPKNLQPFGAKSKGG